MSKAKDLCSYMGQNRYSVYVAVMCMLGYLTNQLATFCLIASNPGASQEIGYGDRVCDVSNQTSVDYIQEREGINITGTAFCEAREQLCDDAVDTRNCSDCCYWRYTGRGTQYQLLAGPLYIVLFAVSGLPMGFVAEVSKINRKVCLGVCILAWSAFVMLGGLSREYWHLVVTRLLTGIASAGCVPFSASIISDYFKKEYRGVAMGFFNWGIYLGYSLTYTLTIAAEQYGWRTVNYIGGAPGLLIGILILTTVKEPERGQADGGAELALTDSKSIVNNLREALKRFGNPALLLLCLGGAIRNGAGICWAYSTVNFFNEYNPGTRLVEWMTWIPLVFGSAGALGGGFLSDKISEGRGTSFKIFVLIGSLVISAPFQVGTLWAPMPWAFVCHMPAYLIGEMWIGVLIAVVVDLVPGDLTTSSVAVYFFIIQIIGGNLNLLINPIADAIGLRFALLITFPGFYLVGALIFVIPLILLRRQEAKERKEKIEAGAITGVNNEKAQLEQQIVGDENAHTNLGFNGDSNKVSPTAMPDNSTTTAEPKHDSQNVQKASQGPIPNESSSIRM